MRVRVPRARAPLDCPAVYANREQVQEDDAAETRRERACKRMVAGVYRAVREMVVCVMVDM